MQNRISYHESVRRVYERIKKDGMTNIWDRYEAQGMGDPDKRCPFCLGGVRCDLCSNGPCRADAAKDKRGVCGITADGMAMRMMLLRNVMGASTYHYHTEQTIKTLRATARGETPFKITEPEKLKTFAERLGVDTSDRTRMSPCVCATLWRPISTGKPTSPARSSRRWRRRSARDLGRSWTSSPAAFYGEMMCATSSCLTNVDGYYVSLALKAMRLGVAMAYQSQIVNEYCQDVLFGIPRPHKMRVDLGVLDPDYVNVLPNGHEPFLGFAMVQLARQPEWQEKAKAVGRQGPARHRQHRDRAGDDPALGDGRRLLRLHRQLDHAGGGAGQRLRRPLRLRHELLHARRSAVRREVQVQADSGQRAGGLRRRHRPDRL